VTSDEIYKIYDVGNGIVCIYYIKGDYSGFVLYDLSSAKTIYVYDTELEELLKAHGISEEAYAGSTHLKISVEQVTPYMVICSYDFGVVFDNNGVNTEASLKGKLAASVYTGETVFYTGTDNVRLSKIDFLASRIDGITNNDELKALAEDMAKLLSLGEVLENSYADENGGVYDYAAGGVTYAYEEIKESEEISETAVTLTVAENIPALLPHGIKHISLGFDLDGCDSLPLGFSSSEDGVLLAHELACRGFDKQSIIDIFHDNLFGFIWERQEK
jgi:hypothetical protein